jgi:hypothetical protein
MFIPESKFRLVAVIPKQACFKIRHMFEGFIIYLYNVIFFLRSGDELRI